MIVFSGLVLYYVFKRDHLFVLSSCLLFAFLQCMNNRQTLLLPGCFIDIGFALSAAS